MPSADQVVSFISGRDRTHFVAKILTPLFFLCIAIVALGIHFLLSPLIVTAIRPEYATLQNYSNAQMCSDASTQAANTAVFQPKDCADVDNAKTIGCVYLDNTRYSAPSNASADQSLVCPLLTSEKDGVSNPSVPVFAVSPSYYQMIATIVVMSILTIMYVGVRAIVHSRRRAKRQEEV